MKTKFNTVLLLLGIMLLSPLSSIHAYTSNEAVSVERQMPAQAYPGETITVTIAVNIGSTLSAPARGFYLTDEVPDSLLFDRNACVVSINGAALRTVQLETGTAGSVYTGAVPLRFILEMPPDFAENSMLDTRDELIIAYRITIPLNAVNGTEFHFSGYHWVGYLQGSSPEEVFGHEDLPNAILTVAGTAPVTTTMPGPGTTTIPVPGTTTTTSTQLTTTSEPPVTSCAISITPSAADVLSKQSLLFSVDTEGACNEHDYVWSVASRIRSRCTQNGKYTAGINFNRNNPTVDVVTVTDLGNDGIAAIATVTVRSRCAIAEIYGTDSKEILMLREYRDRFLSHTPEGREIIRLYYEWSPYLVQWMQQDGSFKEDIKIILDDVIALMESCPAY